MMMVVSSEDETWGDKSGFLFDRSGEWQGRCDTSGRVEIKVFFANSVMIR